MRTMSDLTLFEDDNLPDEYKALLAQLAPETNVNTNSGGGGGNRLSIRGGVFRKVVGGVEVAELDTRSLGVVIVKVAPISRTYYAGSYTPGETSAPTCWASDTKAGTPNANVPAGARQSSRCGECRQNIKGSGQGESRACRYQQRVAVLLADADGTVRSDEVYHLSLPATSVFGDDKKKMGLQAYARFLNSMGRPAPLASLITEMRFDTDSSTPKLTFSPSRPVTPEELKVAIEVQKDPMLEKLVLLSVTPSTAETPKFPDASSAKAEEDEDEPTVRPSAKKEAPPADTTDLSALLDEFDD